MDIDGGRPFYPSQFVSPEGVPPAWKAGKKPYSGAAPIDTAARQGPTCVSCHDVHGGLPGTSLLRAPNTVAEGKGDWCFNCHSAAALVTSSHPAVDGYPQVEKAPCGVCHGTVGTGRGWNAHNGFGEMGAPEKREAKKEESR